MLADLLNKRKKLVLQKWFDAVLETYPADGRKFLGNQTNRFSNPVGASIYEGIDGLYQRLLDGTDLESADFAEFLDRIVRIRAVQEFSPSQALGFLFPLKTVIREVVKQETTQKTWERSCWRWNEGLTNWSSFLLTSTWNAVKGFSKSGFEK